MNVGAVVVDPEFAGLGFFGGGFFIKKEYVGFDSRAVPDAGGEAEEGVEVEALEQALADAFASATGFEEDVVG